MLSKQPVVRWSETLNLADMPHDYFIVFGTFICTFFTILFPYFISRVIIRVLASKILKPEQGEFLLNEYLPEIHEATKDLDIPLREKLSIWNKFVGVMMKNLFAFAYQEHHMNVPYLWTPAGLRIGSALMPWINARADALSGFVPSEKAIREAEDVYPGDSYCRTHQAHALWHEESANGLLDVILLADHINFVLA